MWDVGGQDKLRPLWRSYTRCTDGIIFVVDSTKMDRFEEAKLELLKICKTTHKQTSIPVLILANKQDLPVAVDAKKLENSLGLKELGPSVLWHLQPTCAVTGEGLDDFLEKLDEATEEYETDYKVEYERLKAAKEKAEKDADANKVRLFWNLLKAFMNFTTFFILTG